MTFQNELGKAGKRLAWLLEIEVVKRIDDLSWTVVGGTAAYWTAAAPGKPGRVREMDLVTKSIAEYTEEVSQGDCESTPGSWYFDSATGRLYLHSTGTGGASPASGDFYIAAYYWKRYCDGQYPAPNELVFNGIWYDPRLKRDSIPDLSMEVPGFDEGGIRQTWGQMALANGDGALDQEIVDYIWENKTFVLKIGVPGEAYGSFIVVSRGRTGSVSWNDDEVMIGIEDPMRGEE
jgi:hypothetical protein